MRGNEGCAGETSPGNEEALFVRLEELMGELPAMQRRSERLARARAARAVVDAARELRTCEAAAALVGRRLEEVRAACDAAEEKTRRDILFWEQQRGLRVGPVQNARAALDRALADGGFSDEQDAQSELLGESELAELAHEIETYQREYAEVLARCEAFEAE